MDFLTDDGSNFLFEHGLILRLYKEFCTMVILWLEKTIFGPVLFPNNSSVRVIKRVYLVSVPIQAHKMHFNLLAPFSKSNFLNDCSTLRLLFDDFPCNLWECFEQYFLFLLERCQSALVAMSKFNWGCSVQFSWKITKRSWPITRNPYLP